MATGIVLTHDRPVVRADWLAVGTAVGGPTSAVTGWDALQVRDLVGSVRPPPRIVVLARERRSRTVSPLVVRLTGRPYRADYTPFDLPDLPALPIAGTARAVADASLECARVDDVRALVARAVQRGRCRMPELVDELARCPRNGSAGLRLALDEVGAGARSVAEAHALRILRRERLGEFELNVPLVDERGQVLFVADVLWRELRAVLEIDSAEYHLDRADWHRTMRRHTLLTAGGLSVVHFAPSQVSAPQWAREVRRWLAARAVELGVHLTDRRVGPRPDPVPFVVPGLRAMR